MQLVGMAMFVYFFVLKRLESLLKERYSKWKKFRICHSSRKESSVEVDRGRKKDICDTNKPKQNK